MQFLDSKVNLFRNFHGPSKKSSETKMLKNKQILVKSD